MKTQTQSILPPPPIPPGRVALDLSGDAPQPSRNAANFWCEVRRELSAMTWPSGLSGAVGATIIVLGFFAVSIASASAFIGGVLRVLGL